MPSVVTYMKLKCPKAHEIVGILRLERSPLGLLAYRNGDWDLRFKFRLGRIYVNEPNRRLKGNEFHDLELERATRAEWFETNKLGDASWVRGRKIKRR